MPSTRPRSAAYPVTYMIFDLLHAGAESLLAQPYVERRARLTQLNPTGPAWQTPPSWIGGGADILTRDRRAGPGGHRRQTRHLDLLSRAGGRRPGVRSRTSGPSTYSSAAAPRAAVAGPAPSARCWSECPQRTVLPTSGTSAPGSPTRRSATCSAASRPWRPRARRSTPSPSRTSSPDRPGGCDPPSAERSPTPRSASKAASATPAGGACGSVDRAGTRGSKRPPGAGD